MDRHLAMVRATGPRRSARVGSVVGVGSWATGEYDWAEIAVICPGKDGQAFFVTSSFFFLSFYLRAFWTICFLHFGSWILCGIIHL